MGANTPIRGRAKVAKEGMFGGAMPMMPGANMMAPKGKKGKGKGKGKKGGKKGKKAPFMKK